MKIALITILVYTLVLIGVLAIIPAPDSGKYYDCTIAEIHPDYPPEVKQACRQMMINSRKTYT